MTNTNTVLKTVYGNRISRMYFLHKAMRFSVADSAFSIIVKVIEISIIRNYGDNKINK